jgi:thymidylate synthase (FAD)
MHVEYINHYLSDKDVANFARQSFAKLAEEFSETANNNLVKFLARGMASGDWEKLLVSMTNCTSMEKAKELASYLRQIPEHWVPFGHPHISLRMKAPVPIARQLFKHKIGFVESEESRRYISIKPELYIPDFFREKAESVKQGSGGKHPESDAWIEVYTTQCNAAITNYCLMVESGVCPEQARFILPQGAEVNWVLTGSLYAYANLYNQRSDSHAQKEVQDVAAMVDKIIAPLYPVSWGALTNGKY